MTLSPLIIAIIAASGRRTEILLRQSLPSVLEQSYLPHICIVVDDNNDLEEYNRIVLGLQKLQKETAVQLILLRNNRTQGFSGTGAWNTAIDYANQYAHQHQLDEVYIAILDDDDRWEHSHLTRCAEQMCHQPDAIFCNLTRVYNKYEQPGSLSSVSDLTIPQFLYGNPGVQGSNMCFRLSAIDAIGGFDENLKSCTDRDLMIRFLERFGNKNIIVIKEQTVWHDARSPHCVTNNIDNKRDGLDTFYKKHLWRFDEEMLERSLARAERLFSYPNKQKIWEHYYQNQEIIAVMMPLHNNAKSIKRAVHSVLIQERTSRPVVLFIGNDASTDMWQEEIANYLTQCHNIIILNIEGGSPAKARNALSEYVLQNYPSTYILCRLDADDELCSATTLAEIEQLFATEGVQAVLCGNYQTQGGDVLGANRASSAFHDKDYMRARLQAMAQGDFEAELPSCNLCLRPNAYRPYPLEHSGEDHWLVVEMLLNLPKETFLIAPDQIYCKYSLNGNATQVSRINDKHLDSRIRLYEYYTSHTNR